MRKKNPYTFSHFYLQKSSRKHLRLDLELLWLCIVYPTQLDQFNGRIFLNEIFVCSNQCCHLPSNFKKCFVQLGSSNCQQNVSVDCDEKFEENSTWLDFARNFYSKVYESKDIFIYQENWRCISLIIHGYSFAGSFI